MTASIEPAIAVAELRRAYGPTRALDGVTFSIPRGSLCGLIGPNGAGKTTLLSILATLDEDFDGDAFIGGVSVRDAPLDVRKRLGFVPDHAPLYDALTVRELLVLFASAAGLAKIARRRAVDDAIELCGLASIVEKPAAGLSKGQTERVCVARALLHDPDVLLLDEPASGLDPRARIELKELLKKLGARDKTVLVSSHILTELGDFCDSVVVLERGKVAAAGKIDELGRELSGASGARGPAPRRVVVDIECDPAKVERAASLLRVIDGVREVDVEPVANGAVLSLVVDGPRAIQGRINRALVEDGINVMSLVPEKMNLEALFLTVTKPNAPTSSALEGGAQ